MFKKIAVYLKLIKILLAGKAEVTKQMEQNGWKSTRLWLTLLTIGLNVLGVVIGMLPPVTSMWIIFGLSLAYLILRTVSKFTKTTKDDEFVAALEDPLAKLGVDTKTDKIPEPPKPAAAPEKPNAP